MSNMTYSQEYPKTSASETNKLEVGAAATDWRKEIIRVSRELSTYSLLQLPTFGLSERSSSGNDRGKKG
jgi:hypothetical protein